MTTKQYVSDVITEEEYSKWTGKIILLGAGTGKGKTTFVMNYISWLMKQGKKRVLYLCNRVALKKQTIDNYTIEGLDIVGYQQFEKKLTNNVEIQEYDAFIMDECHYFLDDAAFNPNTDLVYWWLLKQQQHKTRIYMSATGVEVFHFINKCVKELRSGDSNYSDEIHDIPEEIKKQIASDYSYVNNVYLLHKSNDVVKVLNMIHSNKDERAIYFADTITKIKRVKESKLLNIKDNECCYFYGKSSSNHEFVKTHKKIGDIDKYVKGSKRFLFATIALDNGVDIKDPRVKHIFCDIFDFNEVIQCFGRKRVIDENDTCIFYVMIPRKSDLEKAFNKSEEALKEIKRFEEDPNKWEIEDNRRQNGRVKKSKYIYSDPNNLDDDGRPIRTVNRLIEQKMHVINRGTAYMLGLIDSHIQPKYHEVLCRRSGIEPSKVHDVSELNIPEENEVVKPNKGIEPFLEKYCGQSLTDAKKRQLTKLCGIITRAKDKIGRPSIINEYLKQNKFDYWVDNKCSVRLNANNTKSAWIIKKNSDEIL